jgi:release factor glutamine methyltransferase
LNSDADSSPAVGADTEQTVAEALQLATTTIGRGSSESPRLDAEVLLAHVANWNRTQLHRNIMDPLKEHIRQQFWELCEQREKGVPVAYLIGWKEFYSRRFTVRPNVLVPRPETELLVEKALAVLRRTPGPTRILDLCCGTGCIGITLALETLSASVVASDISVDAVELTQENIASLGVGERVRAVRSNLFSDLCKEAFDLIVSNPPYVGTDFGPKPEPQVAAHEPGLALFSGRDGTDHLKVIVERAPAYLIEGGSLVVECASFQAEKVEAWMEIRGYNQTCLWHDLRGLPRGVSGRWEG